MERYFVKFPNLTYANVECKNITLRVVTEDSLKLNPSLYHQYTLSEGERADLLADSYYQDSYYDWLIYLNNGIVDPYYGWYMETYDFEKFIIKKYGSVENAQKRIKYYQLNWPTSDVELTPSFYENSLPDDLKKYYDPIFSTQNKIISYTRKRDDFVTNTNKLLEFTFNTNANNLFIRGEYVYIKTPSLANTIGTCEVVFSNTSAVKVQHISTNVAQFVVTKQINSLTSVNSSSDFISVTHDFKNGDSILYYTDTGNTAITGLSNNTTYYLVNVTPTSLKLSLTSGGSPIDISAGSNETGHYLRWSACIVGEKSNTLAIINTEKTLQTNLTDEEAVFWSPVYFYEYELEKNEKNKNVRLLDKNFSLDVAEELRVILKE